MIFLNFSYIWATMAGGCQAVSKRSGRALCEEDTEKRLLESRLRDGTNAGSISEKGDRGVVAVVHNETAGTLGDKDPDASVPVLVETRGHQQSSNVFHNAGNVIGTRLDMFTTVIPVQQYPFFGTNFESDSGVPMVGRPENFGVVVPGVYRSSYPQSQDYTFLKDLKLRTIVTLVDKEFPESYRSFIAENGIRHHVFSMKGTKKEDIPMKTMKSILRLVLNHESHPLLMHCNHGKHRTGCVVAVVRKVTGWELSNIVDEYRMFAGAKARDCDVKYIQAFDLSNLSNLFAGRSAMQLRTRTFVRITFITFCAMVIWFLSSVKMSSTSRLYSKGSLHHSG